MERLRWQEDQATAPEIRARPFRREKTLSFYLVFILLMYLLVKPGKFVASSCDGILEDLWAHDILVAFTIDDKRQGPRKGVSIFFFLTAY